MMCKTMEDMITDEKREIALRMIEKGKGKCIIYVYARNGYAKKIKITVKK